jgi:hypothetical protein
MRMTLGFISELMNEDRRRRRPKKLRLLVLAPRPKELTNSGGLTACTSTATDYLLRTLYRSLLGRFLPLQPGPLRAFLF